MFVRVKRSGTGATKHEYLQIVESRREGAKVRQVVLGTLGRKDTLLATGTLDSLIRSLAKFSTRVKVVELGRRELHARSAKSWGPALVFGRLWQEQGVGEILRRLAQPRRFELDVERVSFALALQRLCQGCGGSDLQGARWVHTVEAPGFDSIALQHLYRTVGFLASIREPLERELFERDRDLFTDELDLVFVDTTSTFVWRDEETALRRRGHSKDRRPDQPQVMLCVAVNPHGWPIGWDILPGNTADVKAFAAMVEKLRERFKIGRVITVADRGMISADTIRLLTEHERAPFDYILGCRMRRQKEVSEQVLSRAGRYHKVADNLEVKEVVVGGGRFVVCRNPIEQRKDAAARAAIVATLEATLSKHGPKAVIGNKGFARFIKVARGAVSINQAAIEADARLDGKFVLRTSTDLPADEVARAYKSLWRVERTFRETKSTLDVRPIFHHADETTIGHIVACFLALRLEVHLQRRLDDRGSAVAWPDLMGDLAEVRCIDLDLEGERYRLRTDIVGTAFDAFAAAGVRPPAAATFLGPAASTPPHPEPSIAEEM
jgi:hypothetical protein